MDQRRRLGDRADRRRRAFDVGITPSLLGPNGIYSRSKAPKYLAALAGGTHFEWTNAICSTRTAVDNCLQTPSSAKLIADYAIAFFDRQLRGAEAPLLAGPAPAR